MLRYFLKRILGIIVTLLLVSVVVFVIVRLMPGDPIRMLVNEDATLDVINNVKAEFGLDKPIVVQFVNWVKNMLKGDFGVSYRTRQPITTEITIRYGKTLTLALIAVVWSTIAGLALGVWSGVNAGKWQDYVAVTGAVAGQALPSFWVGLLLIFLFGVKLKLLPVAGCETWQAYIMPAFTLGTGMAAAITRFTRSAVLENIKEDYVRTARAKGLSERAVIWRHVLQNSLISVITVVGLQFGALLGGAVMIESVFAYPGLGTYLVTSIGVRDYPIVQALVMVLSANFVVVNLIVDLLYALANPEVRLDGGKKK
ncbi:MAG: ABC transporter permease [bacterium]|nr:ABC transporter permease [bacterium]